MAQEDGDGDGIGDACDYCIGSGNLDQDSDGRWSQTNVHMMELEGTPTVMAMTFDISELKPSAIDWEKGLLTYKRRKIKRRKTRKQRTYKHYPGADRRPGSSASRIRLSL